ncbi:MAG: sugar phosphate isomerase/epimerase [bacterium]|nr:isomerase [Deltaproteobacteria bacterium]MCP4904881.1 sugar phosphate isomerase/epimerase [bacterium]
MKVGMNLLLWTDDPVDESWLPLYERLKGMGFDGVEVPIFDADTEKFADLGKRLDDLGLERTAITVRTPQDDPISSDTSTRDASLTLTQRVLDCCEAVGSTLLGGPLYAAIGQFSGAGPTEEEWGRSVSILQQAADYAARAGIDLSFEFLNRFEIYLLNSTADTARYVSDLDRPNVGIHYDTFHAHIEEKDPAGAIRAHANAISHVHISENDRSTPGRGQVAWDATFDALVAHGYDDWLTIEAFGSALPSLTAATKIWRRMFDDEEELAREGHDFIRREWGKRREG